MHEYMRVCIYMINGASGVLVSIVGEGNSEPNSNLNDPVCISHIANIVGKGTLS